MSKYIGNEKDSREFCVNSPIISLLSYLDKGKGKNKEMGDLEKEHVLFPIVEVVGDEEG